MRKPWKFFHYFASDIWFQYYLLSPFKNVALHRVFLGEEENTKYKTVRIDMKNHGTKDNRITIERCSDEAVQVNSPDWFNDAKGAGVVVHSTQSSIELEAKCIGDGNMRLWLRGKDCRDNDGKRYPVWICVTCLWVDGKKVFNNPYLVCHDKPFIYDLKVTNGQPVKIYMEWQSAVDILAKERESGLKYIEEVQQKAFYLGKTAAETEKKLQETQQNVTRLERAKTENEKKVRVIQQKVTQLEQAKKKTERELKDVKSGWSFKVGRIITYIPRLVFKDYLKK